MTKLVVILPALNEELAIGKLIDEIHKFTDADIIVANNGSTDNTEGIAISKGARVINIKARGKGNAIREAFKLVEYPYCVVMDSDYTYPPKYIPSILAELIDGADIVMGYRLWKKPNSMPLVNSIGNGILSILASIFYRHAIYDTCTGMWGFKKEAIAQFNLTSVGFTLEADLLDNVKYNNHKLVQIPIGYRPRLNGSKAKLRISDGFKIAWYLIKRWGR
jgi:glycosyltransferase involved in cell wall biosynthesis